MLEVDRVEGVDGVDRVVRGRTLTDLTHLTVVTGSDGDNFCLTGLITGISGVNWYLLVLLLSFLLHEDGE